MKGKTNLTSSEFKVLNFFLGGDFLRLEFTKEQLCKAVFKGDYCVNVDNNYYCLIRSLRRKIEANPK